MVDEREVELEEELLRMQIEESRESLSQKIGQLEEKVTETVESATASVAEVTANVVETVQTATASVSETVDTVTSAVQGTVDSVRESVEGTVDSIKEAFDLRRQVELHPWLSVAASVAAGYFVGQFLQHSARKYSAGQSESRTAHQMRSPQNGSMPPGSGPQVSPMNGNHRFATNDSPETSGAMAGHLRETFGSEISKLQSLAIGTALSSLRDALMSATPEPLKRPLAEVIDGVTEKLGGQPLQGSLFTETPNR